MRRACRRVWWWRFDHVLVVMAGVVLVTGCAVPAKELKLDRPGPIPGVSRLAYQDGWVVVDQGTSNRVGTRLIVNGQATDRAALAPGASFIITDGAFYTRDYQILTVGPEQITLKKVIYEDKTARGEGVYRSERVVAIPPYDLDEMEAPLGTAERSTNGGPVAGDRP